MARIGKRIEEIQEPDPTPITIPEKFPEPVEPVTVPVPIEPEKEPVRIPARW